MTPEALLAIRERLRGDEALVALLGGHYPGAPLRTFVGLRPDYDAGTAVPADLFPYLAVSPWTGEQPPRPDRQRRHTISVMAGVCDDREHDGAQMGVLVLMEAAEILMAALGRMPPIYPGLSWKGAAEMRCDMGAKSPYFEIELLLPVELRF